MVAVAAITFTTALLPPIQVWLGKRLVDGVAKSLRHPVSFHSLLPIVIGLGLVTAISRLGSIYSSTQQTLLGERVNIVATAAFLAKAADVDLGNYDDPIWHDRHQRAMIGLNFRPVQLTSQTISLGGSIVTMIGMLGLLFSLHPLLVLLSVGSVIPGLMAQRRANAAIYQHAWTWTADDRERGYLRGLVSDPSVATEVRAFNTGDYLLDRFEVLSEAEYQRKVKLYRLADRMYGLGGLVSGVLLAICYGFVASRGAAGVLGPGDVAALIGALASITTQVNAISSSIANIEQHATFLEDYYAFLDLPRLVPRVDNPKPLPVELDDGIRFEGVHFSYPTSGTVALDGLDLHIRKGEMMALVGDNGAGKTTVVKLLERFYDPAQGRVLVGGVDMRDADPEELRGRIGVLFQDFTKYALTAKENVTFGRVQRPYDEGEIWDAIHRARAAEVLADLRDGLDSRVGRLFEGGHDLSGGQWQRLALARLIYRNADVWILDEPTSALDPEAEAAIFGELREQLAGRIGIVISHRFSTVRIADRIAVLSAGKVIELGTHEELVARGGRYAELFELQAAGYR